MRKIQTIIIGIYHHCKRCWAIQTHWRSSLKDWFTAMLKPTVNFKLQARFRFDRWASSEPGLQAQGLALHKVTEGVIHDEVDKLCTTKSTRQDRRRCKLPEGGKRAGQIANSPKEKTSTRCPKFSFKALGFCFFFLSLPIPPDCPSSSYGCKSRRSPGKTKTEGAVARMATNGYWCPGFHVNIFGMWIAQFTQFFPWNLMICLF